ncbi:hypothetical protein JXA31_08465 [Candidatus Bathyarchaeota archaeon]|nr:hypothetical protein [Candidatus Bathyarchaeota archaeon]
MNPERYLNKNTLMITILLVTSSILIINNVSAPPVVYNETLSPIYRNFSGVSSVFVINNTGTINGNFALNHYLENDTPVASETKQINAGQSLTIDLSQSAPFANDPFTGYVIITADQPFVAEIQPTPTPTPTASPSPTSTSSPFYSPTPEPQPLEDQSLTLYVVGAAITVAAIGLIVFILKKK